jgi:inhibitor of KinA sporulation pathway (predicted exonuclease)
MQMISLTTPQLEMVQKYVELLDTIEEGLAYVEESFVNYERTQGDVVLADIFAALAKISETNVHLCRLFAEETDIVYHLRLFSDVLEEAYKLDGNFADTNMKQRIIEQHLSPAFQAWKLSITRLLKRYVEQ